jgi:hypothetical protein
VSVVCCLLSASVCLCMHVCPHRRCVELNSLPHPPLTSPPQALWALIVYDPEYDVKSTQGTITTQEGTTYFPNKAADYERVYWILHGVLCIFFDARLLRFGRNALYTP